MSSLLSGILLSFSIGILLNLFYVVEKDEVSESIDHFLDIFNIHHTTPIFVNPVIVEKLQENTNCRAWQFTCEYSCVFCDLEGSSFSVMVKSSQVDWGHLEKILLDNGFYPTIIYRDEAKKLDPLHLLACSTVCYHVAFLYWQKEGFWWHEALASEDIHTGHPQIPIPQRAFLRLDAQEIKVHKTKIYIPKDVQKFSRDLVNSDFRRCDYERAKEYYQKYPKNDTAQDILFRHRSWKVLATAKTVLDNLGIVFWLSSGTFLGYYRQCDIFPYAGDVDIGIWIKDVDVDLILPFKKAGFQLKHIFGEPEDSYELSFIYNNIKLDIFFFYEEGEVMWNGGTQAKSGNKYKYIFPRFTVCWTVFLELFIRIPCPEEPYIEANYGRNWSVPIRSWDWKSSPPNVESNGVWPSERRNQVIQVYPG